jgi:hypothetical protein
LRCLGVLLLPGPGGAQTAPPRLRGPRPCMVRTARGSQPLSEGGRGWRRSVARAADRPGGTAPGPHGSGRGRSIRRFAAQGAAPPCGPQSAPKKLTCVPQRTPKGRSEALSVSRRTAERRSAASYRSPPRRTLPERSTAGKRANALEAVACSSGLASDAGREAPDLETRPGASRSAKGRDRSPRRWPILQTSTWPATRDPHHNATTTPRRFPAFGCGPRRIATSKNRLGTVYGAPQRFLVEFRTDLKIMVSPVRIRVPPL